MPYKIYYQGGMWKMKNLRNGKINNVPSANNRADAERVARIREAYSHGFAPTSVKAHARTSSRGRRFGVKRHTRR